MDNENPDRISDLLDDATNHQLRGDTKTAIQILNEAEQLARAGNSVALAYILIQKAGWMREFGRMQEARVALSEAESLCINMSVTQAPLPSLYMEQGIVARQSGDLALAEKLLTNARDAASGSAIEIVVMSDILANLSSVYANQGRLEDAQEALLNAITYDRKTNDPRASASNLNMLGLLYNTTGDRNMARLYFNRSKEIAEKSGLVKEFSDAVFNLSVVSENEGDYTEAETGFIKTMEEAVKLGRREDIAAIKCSLSIIACRRGKFQDAKELLNEAYHIHSDLKMAKFSGIDLVNLSEVELSLGNPEGALCHAKAAMVIAEKSGLLEILWAVHYAAAKARSALANHRSMPEDQLFAMLEEVLEGYSNAADAIDLLRTGIGRPEERRQLLVDKEVVYEMGMFLAAVLKHMDTSWTFVARSRARAFLDMLGAKRYEHQAVKHPLTARRDQMTWKLLEIKDTESDERLDLLQELKFLRSQIIAESPSFPGIAEKEMPDIGEIAASIPADTAIVEFFIGPGNRLTVFVIKHSGLAALHIAELNEFDLPGKIEEFRAEVQYQVEGEPSGELLFQLLFINVWDVFESIDRLLIVPHKELHYLPFAALWYQSVGEDPGRMYLCHRFYLAILPTSSYLPIVLNSHKSKSYKGDAIVFGNPTNDLPSSEAEALAISRLLKVNPLLGKQATREYLLNLTKEHSIIHVASHGIYDEKDPLLSGIILADGRFSVEDLFEAKIAAELLVLSGCVTGISSQGAGDELTGLSRAALTAGIPSIVTSLWEVLDQSTAVFFQKFYSYLSEGMLKDRALIATQHDMINSKEYANPVHWAPYFLLGDYR